MVCIYHVYGIHIIQCNDFSEIETAEEGRVRPKQIVRRKGDSSKLQCIPKYIV